MLILAIDAATRTGWALGSAGGKPRCGAVRLKAPGDPVEVAWQNAGYFLKDILVLDRPDLIALEAPMHPAGQKSAEAVVLQWGVIAVIRFVAHAYSIRVEYVNAQTVSKHFTGKARWSESEGGRKGKKAAAIQRCHLLGYLPKDSADEDRADALACWDYACAHFAKVRPSEIVMFGERVPA